MFDITQAAVVPTATLNLLDARDEPLVGADKTPLSITLHGPGSAEFQRAAAWRDNKALDRLKAKGKASQSAEERLEGSADYYARLTVSFNGWTYPPAGDASGYDLFKAAYSDPSIGFILDQVAEFIGEWGNFTPKPAQR